MSEPDKSGEPTAGLRRLNTAPAASAVTDSAGGVQRPASADPAFGVVRLRPRGAGLARGKKRPERPAANPAPRPTAGYKPSVPRGHHAEVSEYKNPFTGPKRPVSAPEAPTSAGSAPVSETRSQLPHLLQPSPVPDSTGSDAASRRPRVRNTRSPASLPAVAKHAAKAELNILPPEPPSRPSHAGKRPSSDARRRATRSARRSRPRENAASPGEAPAKARFRPSPYPMDAPRAIPATAREPRRDAVASFEPREPAVPAKRSLSRARLRARESRRDDRRSRASAPAAHRSWRKRPPREIRALPPRAGEGPPAAVPRRQRSGRDGWRRTSPDRRGGRRSWPGAIHRGGGGGRHRGDREGGDRGTNRGRGEFRPRAPAAKACIDYPRRRRTGRRTAGRGQRRRRRRGGRGRFRGEGEKVADRGDRGGPRPRPEGQQAAARSEREFPK